MQGDPSSTQTPSPIKAPNKPNGRRATPASYIEDPKVRSVTFSKRKAGVLKKVHQAVALTGCNAFIMIQQIPNALSKDSTPAALEKINGKSRNNYVFGCPAWRQLFHRPEVMALIAKPFTFDSIANTNEPYLRQPRDDLKVTTSGLKDKLSSHSDIYCSINYRTHMSAMSNKRAFQRDFLILDAQEEEEEEECLEEELDQELAGELLTLDGCVEEDEDEEDEGEKPSKTRKQRSVEVKFIEDRKKRGTCFCKRKYGLISKVFELVGKTHCRCLLVLSYPESEGGSEVFHVYCSPDWRQAFVHDGLLDTLYAFQQAAKPPLGFLPLAVKPNSNHVLSAQQVGMLFANNAVESETNKLLIQSYSTRFSNYNLPAAVLNRHKPMIEMTSLDEQPERSEDGRVCNPWVFVCFSWKPSKTALPPLQALKKRITKEGSVSAAAAAMTSSSSSSSSSEEEMTRLKKHEQQSDKSKPRTKKPKKQEKEDRDVLPPLEPARQNATGDEVIYTENTIDRILSTLFGGTEEGTSQETAPESQVEAEVEPLPQVPDPVLIESPPPSLPTVVEAPSHSVKKRKSSSEEDSPKTSPKKSRKPSKRDEQAALEEIERILLQEQQEKEANIQEDDYYCISDDSNADLLLDQLDPISPTSSEVAFFHEALPHVGPTPTASHWAEKPTAAPIVVAKPKPPPTCASAAQQIQTTSFLLAKKQNICMVKRNLVSTLQM